MNTADICADNNAQDNLPRDEVDQRSLNIIFLQARTHNVWLDRPVPFNLIRRAYDIASMGPTTMNCQPFRLAVLVSQDAKERIRAALSPGNVEKTMVAPATLIVAYDIAFQETLPRVFPHAPNTRIMFDSNAELARETAFRNGTLQGGYLCLALRAVGLDIGPMSGFDKAKVDAEFFPSTNLRSNWLINVGYGDADKLFPRSPRLKFDEVTTLL